METTVGSGSSTLTSLLAELAEVFLKAEQAEDATAAAESYKELLDEAREDTFRLQGQVAEAQEVAFNRGQEIDSFLERFEDQQNVITNHVSSINRLASEVADKNLVAQNLTRLLEVRNETINSLQGQLDTARRSFGDAFVYGQAPGTGPTRANRPKLTPAAVGGIRSMVGNGSTVKSVAGVYGVHPSTVSRIARGFYHNKSEGSQPGAREVQ